MLYYSRFVHITLKVLTDARADYVLAHKDALAFGNLPLMSYVER